MASHDYLFKLLIVGESGVGKTCILLRFADNQFEESFLSTIGVDFKVKEITSEGKKVKLQIWDSAGQERFRNITSSYYRNCAGIIVVYDITKHDTFDRVSGWIEEVKKFVPTAPLMVVGNKCDLEEQRTVSKEEGQELCNKHGCSFVESSAKTAMGIDEVFEEMTKQLIKDAESKPKTEPSNQVSIKASSNSNKKGCCK